MDSNVSPKNKNTKSSITASRGDTPPRGGGGFDKFDKDDDADEIPGPRHVMSRVVSYRNVPCRAVPCRAVPCRVRVVSYLVFVLPGLFLMCFSSLICARVAVALYATQDDLFLVSYTKKAEG